MSVGGRKPEIYQNKVMSAMNLKLKSQSRNNNLTVNNYINKSNNFQPI